MRTVGYWGYVLVTLISRNFPGRGSGQCSCIGSIGNTFVANSCCFLHFLCGYALNPEPMIHDTISWLMYSLR